jgi:hypothetical protein
MNLNVFTDIDDQKIAKLPFIEHTVPYIYAEDRFDNGPVYYGAIHLVNQEAYNKIKTRFTGDDYEIKPDAKAYVLPNCSIPQFKIKEILKSLNASFTSDYTQATVFIGSKLAMKEELSSKKETINILGGLTRQNLRVTVHNTNDDNVKDYTSSIYPELYKRSQEVYFNNNFINRISGPSINTDHRFLFPLGVNILYRVLSEKLPIVSEQSLLNQNSNTCIINEELYGSLVEMLNSEDEENVSLALHTISNCNIKESIVYIYFIAKEFARDFRYSLEDMSFGQFVSYLLKEYPTKMTPSVFKTMVSLEATSIIDDNSVKSDLVDIIIVPKKKFAEFHDNLTFMYQLDEC